MADKAKEAASETTETVARAMTELQKLGFGSMAWMGSTWMERMSDMGSEVMQFIADRIREDVQTQHEILHCKDLDELREIQTRFMQRAIDQYTAETGKLVQMSNEMMTEALTRKPPES